MKKCSYLLFLFFVALSLQAQKVSTHLGNNSRLIINGKSNVIGFSFHQEGEKFIKKMTTFNVTHQQNKVYLSENTLVIKIKEFDSDNKMALKDFFKLVKANEHPNIIIKLDYFEANKSDFKNQDVSVNAYVDITLAGVKNKYTIPVKASELNKNLEIKGSKKINIRDFYLTPPVKMMGLIKVDEWIEIEFFINLRLDIEN